MSSIKKFINLELNSFYTKIQLVCKSYYHNVDIRGLNFTVSKTQSYINFVGNIIELWRKRPNPQKIYACWGDKLGSGGRCLYLSYLLIYMFQLPTFKSKSAFGWLNFFLCLGLCTFHPNLFCFVLFCFVFKLWKKFCFELWSSWSFLHELLYNRFYNMITHVLLP